MSYEKELFNEVIYVAVGKLSPNDAADLLEWVESLEVAKRKADEYEAKAKAFDAYHSIISNHIEQQYSHNKHDMVKRFVKIHDEYESGGRNE